MEVRQIQQYVERWVKSWVYRVRVKWDIFMYGQKQLPPEQIPFLITKQMKLDLLSLGYNPKEILHMNPKEASMLLEKNVFRETCERRLVEGWKARASSHAQH